MPIWRPLKSREAGGFSHPEVHKFIGIIVKGVGKHIEVPDEKYDPEQLKMGIEVEKEHTDCPWLSKQIAKDHLAECKDYYTRLKKMEEECENEGN